MKTISSLTMLAPAISPRTTAFIPACATRAYKQLPSGPDEKIVENIGLINVIPACATRA
jgi:hypothetical protein